MACKQVSVPQSGEILTCNTIQTITKHKYVNAYISYIFIKEETYECVHLWVVHRTAH